MRSPACSHFFAIKCCSADFGARKALGHRREFFAPRYYLLLQRLEILPQLGQPPGSFARFPFPPLRAIAQLLNVRAAQPLGTLPRRFRIGMQPRNFRALGRQLLLDPPQFGARLIPLVRRRHQGFLRFHCRAIADATCSSPLAMAISIRVNLRLLLVATARSSRIASASCWRSSRFNATALLRPRVRRKPSARDSKCHRGVR